MPTREHSTSTWSESSIDESAKSSRLLFSHATNQVFQPHPAWQWWGAVLPAFEARTALVLRSMLVGALSAAFALWPVTASVVNVPVFVPVTAMICASTTLGAGIQQTRSCIVGTIIALIWMLIVAEIFHPNPAEAAVALGLYVFVIVLTNTSPLGKKIALAIGIVMMTRFGRGGSVDIIFLLKFGATVPIGGAFAILGFMLPWPRTAFSECHHRLTLAARGVELLTWRVISHVMYIREDRPGEHDPVFSIMTADVRVLSGVIERNLDALLVATRDAAAEAYGPRQLRLRQISEWYKMLQYLTVVLQTLISSVFMVHRGEAADDILLMVSRPLQQVAICLVDYTRYGCDRTTFGPHRSQLLAGRRDKLLAAHNDLMRTLSRARSQIIFGIPRSPMPGTHRSRSSGQRPRSLRARSTAGVTEVVVDVAAGAPQVPTAEQQAASMSEPDPVTHDAAGSPVAMEESKHGGDAPTEAPPSATTPVHPVFGRMLPRKAVHGTQMQDLNMILFGARRLVLIAAWGSTFREYPPAPPTPLYIHFQHMLQGLPGTLWMFLSCASCRLISTCCDFRPLVMIIRTRVFGDLSRLKHAFKLALMIVLASLITMVPVTYIQLRFTYWAPMTVAFVAGETVGNTFRTALHRILGTVAGASFGYLVQVFGGSSALTVGIAFVIWIGIAAYVKTSDTQSYTGVVMSFVASSVGLDLYVASRRAVLLDIHAGYRSADLATATLYAVSRTSETLIGVAIVMVGGQLLWPQSAAKMSRQVLVRYVSEMRNALYRSVTAFMARALDANASEIPMAENANNVICATLGSKDPDPIPILRACINQLGPMITDAEDEPVIWGPEYPAKQYREMLHIFKFMFRQVRGIEEAVMVIGSKGLVARHATDNAEIDADFALRLPPIEWFPGYRDAITKNRDAICNLLNAIERFVLHRADNVPWTSDESLPSAIVACQLADRACRRGYRRALAQYMNIVNTALEQGTPRVPSTADILAFNTVMYQTSAIARNTVELAQLVWAASKVSLGVAWLEPRQSVFDDVKFDDPADPEP